MLSESRRSIICVIPLSVRPYTLLRSWVRIDGLPIIRQGTDSWRCAWKMVTAESGLRKKAPLDVLLEIIHAAIALDVLEPRNSTSQRQLVGIFWQAVLVRTRLCTKTLMSAASEGSAFSVSFFVWSYTFLSLSRVAQLCALLKDEK